MRAQVVMNRIPLVIILVAGFLIGGNSQLMAATHVRGIAESTLRALAPEGYEPDKHVPWKTDPTGTALRIAAFSDAGVDDFGFPVKPVVLGLLAWNGKWTLRDKVRAHDKPDEAKPNYFDDLNVVEVGAHKLILLRTTGNWGGSGCALNSDLYDVQAGKLVLLKSFMHDSYHSYYFALYQKNVYDADVVCREGKRHGKSSVYTCYLQVTRYGFDGKTLVQTGTARMAERHGPWFLVDSYRYMNVEDALRKGEIFARKEKSAFAGTQKQAAKAAGK